MTLCLLVWVPVGGYRSPPPLLPKTTMGTGSPNGRPIRSAPPSWCDTLSITTRMYEVPEADARERDRARSAAQRPRGRTCELMCPGFCRAVLAGFHDGYSREASRIRSGRASPDRCGGSGPRPIRGPRSSSRQEYRWVMACRFYQLVIDSREGGAPVHGPARVHLEPCVHVVTTTAPPLVPLRALASAAGASGNGWLAATGTVSRPAPSRAARAANWPPSGRT